MANISLSPYHLVRPEKVDWVFAKTQPTILESIPSKGLRSFLRKVDELLINKNILVTFQPLSHEAYQAWLPFYTAKMTEQGYDVMAKPEWFAQKQGDGFELFELLFHQNKTLVGSAILSLKDAKATINYKASERIDLSGQSNSSLGVAIDYIFAQKMTEVGAQIISGGRSRNAFGVVNTLGYLDFKLRFGYQAHQPQDLPELNDVPLNENGTVVFFAKNTGEGPSWALYSLAPEGWSGNWDVARFATDDCPFISLTHQL